MTIAFNWYTKQTFTQEEAAKTLGDITINHTVTGLVISDAAGDDLDIDITDGHGRCEGWRVVLSGSHTHTMVAASGNTTYYVYLELTYDGDKVSAVTIEEYTGAQSTTDRIYLGTVEVAAGIVSDATSLVNTYAFEPSKVQISGSTTLDDWKDGTDPTKISGAEIYTGTVPYGALTLTDSIINTDINSAAAIAWSKLNKAGSNLTDIATRSHTSLTDKGSNTHSQIDTHVTAGTNHIADTSNPHGSTMSISTQLTTPRIAYAGTITVESTGGSGLVLRVADGDATNFTSAGDYHNITIECDVNNGGIQPDGHKDGVIGIQANAFRIMAAEFMYDNDGNLGSLSARDDLEDLRKIEEFDKINEWGDKVWDAKTIPFYIKDKEDYERKQLVPGEEGMGFINNSAFKGWMISLLKLLDARLDTLESA